MRAAIFVLLIPAFAHADPLEVIDRGDAVEIVAHNVKATHTTVNPVPDCTGKQCGPDGCGGSCGTCDGTCTATGQCMGTCIPSCTTGVV